jgi:hypothetical protein
MAIGICSPLTLMVVLQLRWAVSECSAAPESNASFTTMALLAIASGSCAVRFVIALATTDWASRKFFTRTVDLPTVTLKLLTRPTLSGFRLTTLAKPCQLTKPGATGTSLYSGVHAHPASPERSLSTANIFFRSERFIRLMFWKVCLV